uniref:hypothetical protein n=1 Tax=uncultured Flavonifractor sp. TaxID=1193534 RepID=UPI00260CD786|nr:hypothetical protein [uncultured Flavonifractor sp.]
MENQNGKGSAIASLVLGIVGVVLVCFGLSIVSLILGIIGLVLASKSKNEGFNGGLRTAGFVLSLLAVIFGAIFFVACTALTGSVMNSLRYLRYM